MDDAFAKRLVPDEFWAIVQPLIPPFTLRPQGGGRAPADPRAVFTTIVYVLVSECAWRLLVVGITAANTHDSVMFVPLLDTIPAIRSRRGPRRRRPGKLHADKGYDYPALRAYCRRLGIAPHIARRGIESSARLGRWRWKIERTLSRVMGYRRLTARYERKARHFAGFLSLAATLVCFKRLAKTTK